MKVARFPLAGSIQARDPKNYADRDQTFINCFVLETSDQMTGGKRIKLTKRMGSTRSAISGGSADSGNTGSCVWQSNTTPQLAFSFTNGSTNTECRVRNQSGTQIGGDIATTNLCTGLCDAVISGTANLVGNFSDSTTGVKEGWYFPEGGAWTQITDTDFPPNQTPAIPICANAPVQMDGYLFWMCTNGQIWNSDLNSVSSYSANNFITASSMPDNGVAIARSSKDLIAAIGTYSIEFFRNAGNPSGSPLTAVENSVIRIGCPNGLTLKTIGHWTYFQGVLPETGQYGIYAMSGMEIKKISTVEIDRLMFYSNSNAAYCYGSTKFGGVEHIIFGGGTYGAFTNYAYCTANGRWWVFKMASDQTPTAIMSLGGNATYASIGSSGSGYMYLFDTNANVDADNSVAMTMTVQLQPLDFGTNNTKFWRYIKLEGDKQSATATVTVSYSDDDGVNFTTAGTIDMSAAEPVKLVALGASRRRVWKFTNATNTPLSLDMVEIGYDVGAH